MARYFIAKDGDILEQEYWDRFIKKDFPSYEKYWQKYIIPLTNRPRDVHFKTIEELKKINKSEHDVYLSQQHYTVLKHLARVYDITSSSQQLNYDNLVEGLSRLCAALDVADEFMERNYNPRDYNAWDILLGQTARKKWRKTINDPNKNITYYRNYLIHCPLLPSFNGILYPKIGCEYKYFKWNTLTESVDSAKKAIPDYAQIVDILQGAWDQTLTYLENSWDNLLEHLKSKNDTADSLNDNELFPNKGNDEINNFKSYYAKGASDIFSEEELNIPIIENNPGNDVKQKREHKNTKRKNKRKK